MDRYEPGTKFNDIYNLFQFDRNLRSVMLKYFIRAEAVLKTACSYEFSKAHQDNLEAYLEIDSYSYSRRKMAEGLIEEFRRILGRSSRPLKVKRDYIRHYIDNHDQIPFWVLSNYLTLGQAFRFFDFIPESIQNAVAKRVSEQYSRTHVSTIRLSPRTLRLTYDHIKDFRNICAHDERLYSSKVSPSKDVPIAQVIRELESVLTKDDYMAMVRDIMELLLELIHKLDRRAPIVVRAMGIESFDETFLDNQ